MKIRRSFSLLIALVIAIFCFPVRADSPVIINRVQSTFSDTLGPATTQYNRMNCYGYAIQVYSKETTTLYETDGYMQQPGEFDEDLYSFQQLLAGYLNAFSTSSSAVLTFMDGRIKSDFSTLYSASSPNNEWTIQDTTANASVPNGYRKIALVIKMPTSSYSQDGDFHFYLRHNNGVWSHKPGNTLPTTKSFTSNVTITDENFTSKITEGGYDDGTRYYLIKKSAIPDYPHENGHYSNCPYTTTSFADRAGNKITHSRIVSSTTSNSANFDYAGDIDYYRFIPSTSGNYRFSTSLPASYDVDMIIYDANGNMIASDLSVGAPVILLDLTAGNKYYIRVRCITDAVDSYTLYHYSMEASK